MKPPEGTGGLPTMNDCPEKARLLIEYSEAARQFSQSVALLEAQMGTIPKNEYDRLLRLSEANRVKSEQARLDMERHAAEHGC